MCIKELLNILAGSKKTKKIMTIANEQKDYTLKLSIFSSMIKLISTSFAFFLGIHLTNIQLSGYQIGILFAISTITSIITVLPSGFSNDRVKSKHLIVIALILLGIEYLGLGLSKNFSIFMLLFLIGGIGETIYNSSIDSLFLKSTNNEKISQKISTYNIFRFLFIGLGIITAGSLLQIDIPFQKLFLGVATLFFIGAIVGNFLLPNNAVFKIDLNSYKEDILQKKVIFFLLIMFLFAIHFGAETTSYGLFLKNNLGLNSFQTGLYMGIAIMTMALTSYLIPRTLKKWKVKYVLLFGLFVSGSGHILMTLKQAMLSGFFRIYHETGDAAMFFFLYYGMSKLFVTEKMGGSTGVFQLATTLGATIGALIFGPIGSIYGYHMPLIISGCTTLIAWIISTQVIHHFDHS